MEPEGSLPHSQVPATCPYLEPNRSSPYPTYHFLNIHLNIIFPSTPGSSKWSLSLSFPHNNTVYAYLLPIHATCPAHRFLLDFIILTILGEQYRLLSSSLRSFLHSPVTSSLLGHNILLNHQDFTRFYSVLQVMLNCCIIILYDNCRVALPVGSLNFNVRCTTCLQAAAR